jgi:hypothetical protein
LQGGTISGTTIVANTDPLFTTAGSNFRLQSLSPAINIGNNAFYNSGQNPDLHHIVNDLAGDIRIQGCTIDLGAYETSVVIPGVSNVPNIQPDGNGIIYVTKTGTGNGSSWANAYGGLADPLAYANGMTCINEIRVASGTYMPTRRADDPMNATQTSANRNNAFVMVTGVKVYGGFDVLDASTQSATVPAFGTTGRQGVSILSGDVDNDGASDADNAYHVVMAAGDMGLALLDGFTVSGGYSTSGNSGSISVNGIPFTGYNGAGIVSNGKMTFSNIIVKDNTAYHGAGIYLAGAGSVFTTMVVAGNTASYFGGGIYVNGGTHTMTNVTVTNNKYSSNTTDRGAGIYCSGGALNLRNSIIWGNLSGSTPDNITGTTVNHSYNLLQDGTVSGTAIISNADPMFTDAVNGNYRLQSGSPAANEGNNAFYDVGQNPDLHHIVNDLDGSARIQGCLIDLGAYESSTLIQGLPVIQSDVNGVIYVTENGTGNGSSWANAYGGLDDPLAYAKILVCIKEIRVAAGTYKPKRKADDLLNSAQSPTDRDNAFVMIEGVKIYGGFNVLNASTQVSSVPAFGTTGRQGVSILSGDVDNNSIMDNGNAYHVVMAAGDMGDALLDGFTVTGGYSDNNQNHISINGRDFERRQGAGIAVDGTMTFSNIIVTYNTANYGGGGIYLRGLPSEGSTFTNTVVANNTSGFGGGILIWAGTTTMTNITVANNAGEGIHNDGGDLNLRNSIIWGNATDNITLSSGVLNHSYNLLQGGSVSGATIVSNANPLFIDAAAGNYRLRAESPAIDMGKQTLFTAGITDLAGNPRVQGCEIDLGACEASATIAPIAGRVYVKEGGAGDGSSWDNAYPNLAFPLRIAKICGITEIRVAEGVYYPMFSPTTDSVGDKTFLMVEDVKIYGGFDGILSGAPTALPVFGAQGRRGKSILSGDVDNDGVLNTGNARHVVMAAGDMGAALLDGFTITGGYSDNNQNHISINGRDFESRQGAGVAVDGAMTFTNITVTNNTANHGGGGIYLRGLSGENSTFTNMIVANNTSGFGGGILIWEGTTTMTNITVANNTGDGIRNNGGVLNLRNSIIWGNTTNNIILSSGVLNHSYNLLQNEALNGTDIISNADPMFVDAITGNYRLDKSSPAIDKGNNTFYNIGQNPDLTNIIADIDGNPRIGGGVIDLGAHEYRLPIIVVNDSATTTVSMPVTIDILANDDYSECTGSIALDSVAGSGLHYGILTISVDKMFVYTPNAGHFGIDSVDYELSCSGNLAQARVYILTLDPLSKEYYACPGASTSIGYEHIPDVHYEWYDDNGKLNLSSDAITVTKDDSGNPQTYYAQPVWKGVVFPFDTVRLYPSSDIKPAVRDIRVILCPSPVRNIRLSSFLDSLDYASPIQWQQTDALSPAFSDVSSGTINTGNFHKSGIYTYQYVRQSECLASSSVAKAYVYIPRGKTPPRPDTILVCVNQIKTINVNSITGLEYGGNWLYDDTVNPDNTVSGNVVEVAPPSQLAGMVMFNVKTAYQQATDSNYNVSYRGVSGKKFVFEYVHTTSTCDSKTTRIVIVGYE